MRASLLVAGLLLAGTAEATSLQDQINAVRQVELQQQAARQAEIERAQREQEAALARAWADQQARDAERFADKRRDQGFEDELRQLEIEERKLKLAQMKARTERTNDYIDQELREQAAHTDVVQSRADATRNLSEGGKSLLQSEGVAREKEAGNWFK